MSSSEDQFKALGHGYHGEDEVKEEHPSYGQLGFFRSTGGNPNLYGSSIKHSQKIVLEISRSQKIRNLHRTWYFPRQEIIRLEMSPTQFAEAITTMGSTPVPVTITRLEGDLIPDCPEENTRQRFVDEFKQKVGRITGDMKEDFKTARDLLKQKGTLKVADREAIASLLNRLEMEIRSNIPFVHSQFDEAVDKTVTEAKGEIEAFFENKVRTLGLEAAREKGMLPDQAPSLQLDVARTPVIETSHTKGNDDDEVV